MEQKKRKRKKLYLLGALALALVISGGLFAYTYTTASITLSGTAKTEFASVTIETAPDLGNVFGKAWGAVDTGDLFTITFHTDYSGDLLAKLYLVNADDLKKAYQHLNMMVQVRTAAGGAGDPIDTTTGRTFELLTLDNGVVTFTIPGAAGANRYVYLAGGSYKTNPRSPVGWTSSASVNPLLWLEVTQR